MVVDTYNPTTQEPEVGGSPQVQDQPELWSKTFSKPKRKENSRRPPRNNIKKKNQKTKDFPFFVFSSGIRSGRKLVLPLKYI